ncbi:hypothetical protein ACO2Q8_06745 [Larkinella sp. VNQ87]|uniref:hypothetical protein n=1 Tax=Larkinella sp. VNQ87 TaxID=3400921 RepID=UPI003C038194
MASLQELPDDELDKLFRSSAEEFEPPYNPDDWNSLRRRLDDADRSRFLDRFIYWGIPVLLLILSAVSLFVKPEEGSSAVRIVAENTKSASVKDLAPDRRAKAGPALETAPAEQTHPTPENETGDAPEDTDAKKGIRTAETADVSARTDRMSPAGSVDPNRVSDQTAETKRPARSGTGLNDNIGPAVSTNRRNATNEVITPETGSRLRKTVNRTKAPARPVVAAAPNRNRFGKSPETAVNLNPTGTAGYAEDMAGKPVQRNRPNRRSLGSSDAVSETVTRPSNSPGAEPPVSDATETTPIELPGNLTPIAFRRPTQPRLPALPEPDPEPMRPPVVPNRSPTAVPVIGYPALSIRVVAAPDFNFVGSSKQAARDLQIGVLGEYRFLRRLTVQSGVLRSVKKYRAAAADYTKPPHWYGPKYESVDAECTVLDIPVNLRYDVVLNERQRWFVSAGVSSFIMQKEYYEYKYPKGVYPNPAYPQYKRWSGKTGFHEFSHLNVSLGYERNFRPDGPLRRFSWQVEPFLKNPRGANLGYGKIRLTSAGIFFSIRYRL